MIRTFIQIAAFSLATLFCTSAAQAETVRVRSGEHDGFTRLVLVLSTPSEWQLGRIDRGFGLRLSRDDITLDLSRAFDLIPKTRIAQLQWDNSTSILKIGSQCNCYIKAFEIGERTIVLDVTDGPAPADNTFNNKLDLAPESTETAQAPDRASLSKAKPARKPIKSATLPPFLSEQMRQRYDRPMTLPRLTKETKDTTPPLSVEPSPKTNPKSATDPFAAAAQRRRIAEIEAELIKQLARAGSQGMVQPNPKFAETDGGVNTPSSTIRPNPHPGSNVDAITGVDRAVPEAATPPTDSTMACLSPEDFAFLTSEPDEKPHTLISNARRKLLQEFDSPNTYAAAALARSYLYLGFGAEAQQVIETFLQDTDVAPLYSAIAASMDYPSEGGTNALTGQANCPGPASFWALLSQPVPTTISEDIARDIRATASDLPLHLRRWLVPRLAQKLLARGHTELAAALRDSLARADGNHGNSYALLQAALAERGDYAAGGNGRASAQSRAAAESLLEKVTESNNTEAATALLNLLRLEVKDGNVPPPERFSDVEAVIFENRDTPLVQQFHLAVAPAYALDGNFTQAFAHIDAAAALAASETDELSIARDSVALMLAKEATDSDFLKTLFSPARSNLGNEVTNDTTNAIARRLLALGFPEEALAQSETLPAEPEYRLTRIRALQALGRYERALASLSGLQGPESDTLRSELFAQLGENNRAYVMARIAGNDEIARRAAWASGDPEAIRESGNESETAFIEATSDEDTPGSQPQPSLAGTESLLEEARKRRNAIEAILQEKSNKTNSAAPVNRVGSAPSGN